MSSSFLGQSIEVKLHSGGIIRGKITNIDAATGSLSVLRVEGGSLSLTRAEIADLKMLPNEATIQSPANHAATVQDPAIISYTQAARKAVQSPILPSNVSVPRAPAAMMATSSDTGSVERQGKPTKIVGKRANGKGFIDIGTSSRTHTEDETEYESARNGKKKNTKDKKKSQRQTALIAQESDLDEDFDFDKALKGFDKRKIWQEIKVG